MEVDICFGFKQFEMSLSVEAFNECALVTNRRDSMLLISHRGYFEPHSNAAFMLKLNLIADVPQSINSQSQIQLSK